MESNYRIFCFVEQHSARVLRCTQESPYAYICIMLVARHQYIEGIGIVVIRKSRIDSNCVSEYTPNIRITDLLVARHQYLRVETSSTMR